MKLGALKSHHIPQQQAPANGGEERPVGPPRVVVLGLGYVGLPTALSLHAAGINVAGVDISPTRLVAIREHKADLLEEDKSRLETALASERFQLTNELSSLGEADIVLVCVPTPVDAAHNPDLRTLRAACETVVAHARVGQTFVLTSTTYVGCTRDMLTAPLEAKGFRVGSDLHVVFSPERIDPGNTKHPQHKVPRVLGGVTPACARSAAQVLQLTTPELHIVSSPEVAEITKLTENTFRAVNVALANEIADIAVGHGLDPVEVVEAAATKPYGFMAFYPGAGVGGHCIPCDPHYLLSPPSGAPAAAPMIEQAMYVLGRRPGRVVQRAIEILQRDGIRTPTARVMVCGVTYKPGVADIRESPSLLIINALRGHGVDVGYHDPLVPSLKLDDGSELRSVPASAADLYHLVVLCTAHPGADISAVLNHTRLLDTTYRAHGNPARNLI